MRGRYILLMVALALICAACASGSSQRIWWPQTITVGPKIVSMVVPEEPRFGVRGWRFSAETSGSPVVSWEWDFGGGASPNESTEAAPYVYLLNPSFDEDAKYTCTLIVRDAQGNSDTMSIDYYVGLDCTLPPTFVDLPSSINGNFSFSINDVDGDPVEITLGVTQGEGVTVEPPYIHATSENYGPFNITVTNHNIEDTVIGIEITLDNGDIPVDGYVSGTIPGIRLPANIVEALTEE